MKENKKIKNKKDLEEIKNHYQRLLPKKISDSLNRVIDKKVDKQQKKIKELKKDLLSAKKDVYFNNVKDIIHYR